VEPDFRAGWFEILVIREWATRPEVGLQLEADPTIDLFDYGKIAVENLDFSGRPARWWSLEDGSLADRPAAATE
jgi:hypothetical protein